MIVVGPQILPSFANMPDKLLIRMLPVLSLLYLCRRNERGEVIYAAPICNFFGPFSS